MPSPIFTGYLESLWNDDTNQPVAGGWPVLKVDTSRDVDVEALAREVLRARAR